MTGQRGLGVEDVVAVRVLARAADDTGSHAVLDRAGGPTLGSHVGEGTLRRRQAVRAGLAKDHVSDDLGALLTGEGALRVERAILAVKDLNGTENTNCFRIVDVSRVRISRGAGADRSQTQGHDHCQYQCE